MTTMLDFSTDPATWPEIYRELYAAFLSAAKEEGVQLAPAHRVAVKAVAAIAAQHSGGNLYFPNGQRQSRKYRINERDHYIRSQISNLSSDEKRLEIRRLARRYRVTVRHIQRICQ